VRSEVRVKEPMGTGYRRAADGYCMIGTNRARSKFELALELHVLNQEVL
jgi:hypothetical protein